MKFAKIKQRLTDLYHDHKCALGLHTFGKWYAIKDNDGWGDLQKDCKYCCRRQVFIRYNDFTKLGMVFDDYNYNYKKDKEEEKEK